MKVLKVPDVIVTFKVMPTSVDVDLDKVEKELNAAISPQRIVREPIAFGLVALNVTTFVEDSGGQVEKLEEKIRAIEGVADVEVTEVTRSL